MKRYTSHAGADAYPPLLLMKALLLHKWFNVVEQYFGLSHLHMDAFRARFTQIIKNGIDALFRQMAFNIFRGGKVLGTI